MVEAMRRNMYIFFHSWTALKNIYSFITHNISRSFSSFFLYFYHYLLLYVNWFCKIGNEIVLIEKVWRLCLFYLLFFLRWTSYTTRVREKERGVLSRKKLNFKSKSTFLIIIYCILMSVCVCVRGVCSSEYSFFLIE